MARYVAVGLLASLALARATYAQATDRDAGEMNAVVSQLLMAWCLLALTVTIHAAGMAVLLRRIGSSRVFADPRPWPVIWLLVRLQGAFVVLHLAEITLWALFYWAKKCQPDAESALYFSAVTYTTVGYGDVVLPMGWRLMGTVEALTGILMCGLSTGAFVAVVSRLIAAKPGAKGN